MSGLRIGVSHCIPWPIFSLAGRVVDFQVRSQQAHLSLGRGAGLHSRSLLVYVLPSLFSGAGLFSFRSRVERVSRFVALRELQATRLPELLVWQVIFYGVACGTVSFFVWFYCPLSIMLC